LQGAEFLADAAQDEFTQLFPDPASADGVIGFHAQQAGEKMKMLNAVLASGQFPIDQPTPLPRFSIICVNTGHRFRQGSKITPLRPLPAELRYEDLPDEPGAAL
jgi:hypothetical protein